MEKVILVGVEQTDKKSRNSPKHMHESLDELKRLTVTAGGFVARSILQKRPRFDPATLIGKGKAYELLDLSKELNVKTIIFDEELSPAQQRNLEDITKTKVIDRTRLILDIFAQRAHTREGSLQVELAQMQYLISRLTGWGKGFSQQMGGIGTRGPGERKLEVETRHMRNRINHLKKELISLRKHRSLQRKQRTVIPLPTITFIGYTNTGKSTLLNTLSKQSAEHAVYVDDKLFATLDPTTRRVTLPNNQVVLFTDTVGFIRKLPHSLIAAFHATLEEALNTDMLVHVVDASSPEMQRQMETVISVLKELGYNPDDLNKQLITIYNKIDRLSDQQRKNLVKEGICAVSALTGEGIYDMLDTIQKILHQHKKYADITVPFAKMNIVQHIYRIAAIIEEEHTPEGLHLKIMIDPQNYGRILKKLT
ncbi:MAG: GTPase HflX [bacterium]